MTDTQILWWTSPLVVLTGGLRAYMGDPLPMVGAKVCLSLAACCVVAVWFRGNTW